MSDDAVVEVRTEYGCTYVVVISSRGEALLRSFGHARRGYNPEPDATAYARDVAGVLGSSGLT